MDYTIIGLQKNGKLGKVEELDLIATVSGHLTPEEMLEHVESSAKTGTIGAIAVAVVLLGVGVLLIVKGNRKKN